MIVAICLSLAACALMCVGRLLDLPAKSLLILFVAQYLSLLAMAFVTYRVVSRNEERGP